MCPIIGFFWHVRAQPYVLPPYRPIKAGPSFFWSPADQQAQQKTVQRKPLEINKSLTAREVKYKNTILAWVAELVDARDLKSLGPSGCAGSIPAPGTSIKGLSEISDCPFLFSNLFG